MVALGKFAVHVAARDISKGAFGDTYPATGSESLDRAGVQRDRAESCGSRRKEQEEEDESAPPSSPSGSVLFPALWQAKAHVKWLLEFMHRGQRENKNITRELQLQPSNMTSVCF